MPSNAHFIIDNDYQSPLGGAGENGKGNDIMFMERGHPAPSPSPARCHVRPIVWAMAARSVTALVGGYAAAAVLATLAARLLPVDRVEATGWAMILSFLTYAAIGLWCFHEPRLARVAGFVWGVALLGGAALWWLGVRP